MLETNIRLVKSGTQLYLDARHAVVRAQHVSADILEKACGTLRRRFGLAGVPFGPSDNPGLLIAANESIGNTVLDGDDWRVEVSDTGQPYRLRFSDPADMPLLARLIERCILVEIARRTNLEPSPDSPRIWCEPEPFRQEGDISAYRRFEVSTIPIASVGLGVVVDVGTAFFTNVSVADYFDGNRLNGDQESRRKRFETLGQRQKGQKGTLLYDLGESKHKCYYEEYLEGVTCATTEPIKVQGETYRSLYEYYCRRHPNSQIGADEPVAKVSFSGMDRPQLVAATRLRLRVMNEALPDSLKDVDKIAPAERVRLLESFWARVREYPLGQGRPDLESGFWRPGPQETALLPLPVLEFANGQLLTPPANPNCDEYKEHYRRRLTLLKQQGCWDIPPNISRVIHFAFPARTGEGMVSRFCDDVLERLSNLTRHRLESSVLRYSSVEEALSSLSAEPEVGMVVFVFEDEDPATYFDIAYGLKRWRVKRVTYSQLAHHFDNLVRAEAELSQARERRRPPERSARGIGLWRSFVEMNALDIVQQLDCIPWRISSPLPYEAQLSIDVGRDRSHFSLCLSICRDEGSAPSSWLDTIVEPMPYPQRETIPAPILRDKIIEIFQRVAKRKYFVPLKSALVLRDGRECGDELETIRAAHQQLVSLGILDQRATLHIVDYHKRTSRGVRLWERTSAGVSNVLEGRAVFLGPKMVIIASTGVATLTQGTAEVSMLEAREDGIDLRAVARDAFARAQLNWSSPRVAQRLPISLERTDQELEKRSAQEIRRIS